MKRIPDIFDVWIDAGCAGFICFNYPQKEEDFNERFPADLVLEGKDQIRGWFNLLMVTSMLAFDKPSFKNVYMHGFINDYRGIKMSKSIGNITDPQEVIASSGADSLRYYTIGAARAGMDMNYNPEDPKSRLKNLLILWNVHKFIGETINNSGFDIAEIKLEDLDLGIEEKYILSRLNSTIKIVTEKFDTFHLYEVPQIVEDLYLDLSRNYIQYIREKLAVGSDDDKKKIIKVLSVCIIELAKLFSPIVPFITEKIYLNLKEKLKLTEDSIHLCAWPKWSQNRTEIKKIKNKKNKKT